MNKYQNGKIYKITSKQTDYVYIGSTTQLLNDRFTRHKFQNTGSSTKLIKYDDCIIELIEDYPCKTKEELLWRERYWIENMKGVNEKMPIRTKEEITLYKREYQQKNKERVKYNRHIRYENNKEYYQKKNRIYKAKYKGQYKGQCVEQRKEYYQKNKENIREYDNFRRSEFGKLCKMF